MGTVTFAKYSPLRLAGVLFKGTVTRHGRLVDHR